MLFADKYKITDKSEIIFHKNIFDKLLEVTPYPKQIKAINKLSDKVTAQQLIAQCCDYATELENRKTEKFKRLKNLLIHGVHKMTLIKLLLKEIYGPIVENITTETYKITGYGNKEEYEDIKQSPYHIIIEPKNTGIDKYIIEEIVKEYAQQSLLCFEQVRVPYRVVLINNVDNLSHYAQASLRSTMEQYYRTCRFILCSKQPSKLLDPLRSRCNMIRIPKPTEDELFMYLYNIAQKENIDISFNVIRNIISNSNRNSTTCLWWLEYYKNNNYDFTFSWKTYLNSITALLQYVHKTKKIINVASIILIRQTFNKILITNIPGPEIVVELLTQIVAEHPEYRKEFVTNIATVFQEYELRLARGTRSIMHLEALVMKLFVLFFEEPFTIATK